MYSLGDGCLYIDNKNFINILKKYYSNAPFIIYMFGWQQTNNKTQRSPCRFIKSFYTVKLTRLTTWDHFPTSFASKFCFIWLMFVSLITSLYHVKELSRRILMTWSTRHFWPVRRTVPESFCVHMADIFIFLISCASRSEKKITFPPPLEAATTSWGWLSIFCKDEFPPWPKRISLDDYCGIDIGNFFKGYLS